MKKIISVFLCMIIAISLVGCAGAEKTFSQTMTIARMPSPPKCKTFSDITAINEVLNTLGLIEKEKPIQDDVKKNGWYYMIKLNVDGTELIYTVGGTFNDADGRQYEVGNWDEIKTKLDDIYDKIDTAEVDYK